MLIIPTWRGLSKTVAAPVFKSSIAILIAVPLMARLSAAATAHSGNLFSIIIQIFDAPVPEIPTNLLRAFWGSMMIGVAQVLFRLRCPLVVRAYADFSEWSSQADEAFTLRKTFIRDHGSENANLVDNFLRQHYEKQFSDANRSRALSRFVILFLNLASAYLGIRVIVDQILIVFRFSSLHDLLL
ncbi:MAG TPA: hypothetical protein VN667_17685 [Burkholderiales bacterium]|nr:hypothetical protein [Burkholderiales bacterium]